VPSILFLHENYPAQFGVLADRLARKGWDVVFGTQKKGLEPGSLKTLPSGVRLVRYARKRDAHKSTHEYLTGTENAILNGQGFARMGVSLAKTGFKPDIVVAHSGWGSGSFAKVVWPDAKFVQYLEWWYSYPPVDTIPGAKSKRPAEDQHARTLVRNLPFMLDFQQADLVIAPTAFQAELAPDFVRSKMIIQHDGVDCELFSPHRGDAPAFTFEGLPDDAPIVTFATRGMEPTRGFPTFMEAASALQKARPDVHIVVAGNTTTHYGGLPAGYESWKDKALEDHDFDHDRLHFTGLMPKRVYAGLLKRSNAHTYLSVPFVLSWSIIEAMACGAPMIVTDVASIREAVEGPDKARIVPLADAKALEREMAWCLDHPEEARAMGARARERALSVYDAETCHAAFEATYLELMGARPVRSVSPIDQAG